MFVGARLRQELLSSTTRSYTRLRNCLIIYVVEKVRREKWRATGLGLFLNLISQHDGARRRPLFVAPRRGPLSALKHGPGSLLMKIGDSSLRRHFASLRFEIWRVNFLTFVHRVLCCRRRWQPVVGLLEQRSIHAEEKAVAHSGH